MSFSLLTGFFAISQWSLIPAQNRLSATAYTTLEQGMNDVLERLTAGLMVVSTVSAAGVLVTVRRRGGRDVRLASVALACIVAMVVSTLTINAPVNFAIDRWNPADPPADWMQLRDRWEAGHTLRTYVGLLGLLGLLATLVSVVWPGARSEHSDQSPRSQPA